ncbi:hypothetical protein FNV43_RR24578 [Rhamnella rubrinervis]|uniref:Uncharacterized protein n=1 Tax=Rhamnella rubrinervis TaxID=2594499 RepID=A0A8K0DN19_9ROSA|nr:hypothetical protein FNV43_RR24578 [Rhamnella rubrinervis]
MTTVSGVDGQLLPAIGDHGQPPIDLDGPAGDLNREGENKECPIDLKLPPSPSSSSPFSQLSKGELRHALKNNHQTYKF